ncbi:MAG: SAM-dependent methyltransferase, partial [Acidobacteriota bacterium]|nr:SAM-dependent methyltransferase [Acidobacteriota bacterium]
MPGTLYLVATPIGNLEDITIRAVRILGEVKLIAAEDTRRAAILLRHYAVKTATISLHEHNEQGRAPKLVERLLTGDSIALL